MAKRTRMLLGAMRAHKLVEDEPLIESMIFKNRALLVPDLLDSERDKQICYRNIAMLANTLFSIILMVVTLQLQWTGLEMIETLQTNLLKVCISLLTLMQMLQISDYYVKLIQIEAESASNIGNLGTYIEVDRFGSEKKKVEHFGYTALWKIPIFRRKYISELLVHVPHPFPFTGFLFDKLGLLMFFRMYIVLKVARDFSAIYKKRKIIQKIPGYSPATHPSFNTFLINKMFFYQYPIMYILFWILTGLFSLGYCLYVFEREAQPEEWGYWISFFIAVNSMLAGWGSDTYDNYVPLTWFGKCLAIVGVVIGVFLFALLIDYVHTKMQPTAFQSTALQWVVLSDIVEKERESAAKLIQIIYRYYIWKKKAKQEGIVEEKVSKKMHKKFLNRFLLQMKATSKLRRMRIRHKITDSFETRTTRKDLVKNLVKDTVHEVINEVKTDLIKEFAELLEKQRQQILNDLQEKNFQQTSPFILKS